jgi:hypothetical protein
MSIGFMIDAEQPMVWRGPMVTQALTQLLGDTEWGELDYLVIDMPPGTGDIQLTLAQRVPVSGAVIVTTPQDIALLDARKGLKMFEKVEVRVLGVVENMSVHVCSACGHVEHVFGSGGGARMAEQYGVQLLGELPLDIRIREDADGGAPTVVSEPGSPRAQAYLQMDEHQERPLDQAHGRLAGHDRTVLPGTGTGGRGAQDHFVWDLELWLRCSMRRRIQDLHQHQFDHRGSEELRRKVLRGLQGTGLHHSAELVCVGANGGIFSDSTERLDGLLGQVRDRRYSSSRHRHWSLRTDHRHAIR